VDIADRRTGYYLVCNFRTAVKEQREMSEWSRRELLGTAARSVGLASIDWRSVLRADDGGNPRVRLTFDWGWKFRRGDMAGAESPSFHDEEWRSIDLPHDWSIEGPFAQNEPTGGPGGYLPTGIGWYRKRFQIPETYRGRKATLEFDGIYQNSEVWINGNYLGQRPYGYISFAYDLTPCLRRGDNVVAVRVDNSRQPNSRWYSGSGIYRHTWLTVTNHVHIAQLHIAQWGTFVTTPRISPRAATVRIQTRVRNETSSQETCTLLSAVTGPDGAVSGQAETERQIAAGDEYEFSQEVEVEAPVLWSVERPNLYRVRSTLRASGNLIDSYETVFGIREAAFDADRGFLLNGERVKLNGMCLHHEAGCVGAAVPERVWERRLQTLREMGCNAIRTSHNPPAPEFLDLCDRMGFLVMNETFDEWRVGKGQIGPYGYSLYFEEWHERDATDFIWRDRREKYYSPDRHAHPQRRFVCTESSGMGGVRGDYSWLFPAETPSRPGFSFGPRSNSMLDTEELWKFTRVYDYVSGAFMWTGIDYLGESRWPFRSASAGVLDTCGFKKDGFYFYQSQWGQAPVLHLFPHWNWKGREGQFIPVMCYTNCDTVQLFLNGKLEFPRLGMERKWGVYPKRALALRTTYDLHLAWDAPYEPGVLHAVGEIDGKPVIETEISTTGAPGAVSIACDRSRIRADHRDVVHITAQVADAEGRVVPDAENEIVFAIRGGGNLLGVDNGDPESHESFQASHRKAFHGLCLAIVQARGAGEIEMAASSPGLASGKLMVAAVS
jgi:beta-galactosidase